MKKNIVYSVTKRYMMKNKKRTTFSFIGIMFMVMLLTCVFVGKDTVFEYLEDVFAEKKGRWEVNMYDLSEENINELKSLDYIVDLGVSAHIGMMDFKESKNESTPYFNIKAYNKKDFELFNIKLLSGRLPQNMNEAVISETALEENPDISEGFRISGELFERQLTNLKKVGSSCFPFYRITIKAGETIDISEKFPYMNIPGEFREDKKFLGKNTDITIVGVIRKPFFENADQAGYNVITLLDSENLPTDTHFNASVTWEKSASGIAYDKFEELAGKDNIEENKYFTALSGTASDEEIKTIGLFAESFFYIIIAVSSVILIYNLFNLSYIERCKYLGMLSSVGATAKQKRSSVYYEVFSLLMFALPIGFILGLIVVAGGMKLLSPNIESIVGATLQYKIENIPFRLIVKPSGAALVILMSMVTVLVSALFPAFKISRKGAVEGIRGNETINCKKHRTNKNAFRKNGSEKLLASAYFGRQKRKKFGMCISVIVMIVVFIVTSYLSSSIISLSAAFIKDETDILVLPHENEALLFLNCFDKKTEDEKKQLYDNFIDNLKTNSDVIEIKNEKIYTIMIDGSFFSKEYLDAYRACVEIGYNKQQSDEIVKERQTKSDIACIISPDDETVKKIADKLKIDPLILFDDHSVIAVNNAVVSTDSVYFEEPVNHTKFFNIDNITDKKAGDYVSFENFDNSNSTDIKLAGIVDYKTISDYISVAESAQSIFIADAQTVRYLDDALSKGEKIGVDEFENYYIVEFTSTDCSTINKLRENDETSGIEISVATNEDMEKIRVSFPLAVKRIVVILLGCFVALVSVICLMNMLNTAQGRIAERRKDFAILKSVGMTNKQIEKSLITEILKILLMSLIISAIVCAPIMFGISSWMNSLIGHIKLPLPIIQIILAIVVTSFFIIFITLRSFRKYKDMDIIKNIVSETT